jgi:hypothetical protein
LQGDRFKITPQSLRNRYFNRFTFAPESMRDRFTIAAQSLRNRFTFAAESMRDRFAIAAKSQGCCC